MAKSEEMNKAIKRVKDHEPSAEERALATIEGDMSTEMEQFDPRKLAAMVAAGEMEAGQQIMELEEGFMIEGQLLGRGDPAMLDDPNKPGEMRAVPTWRMRLRSGVICTFIGAAQLERQLPPFVGRKGNTIIARGATSRTKRGRQLTHYYVVGPPADAPRFDERVIEVRRNGVQQLAAPETTQG